MSIEVHSTRLCVCVYCKHFINDKKFGCKAFDKIPDKYLLGTVTHSSIVKGQKGKFVFTPVKDIPDFFK